MMNPGSRALARLASRDSLTTLLAMATVALLCWWYLIDMAWNMAAMMPGDMMRLPSWTPPYFVAMLVMWIIMMIAMMLPSAAPMILLYRQVALKNQVARPAAGTALFLGGYVVIWGLFSVVATALQWLLEQWALLGPMMQSQSLLFSGIILVAAGVYQWTPWKSACLRHCRGPFFFITRHWRPGLDGAFRMGLTHGAYCLGCCWALMALLFVGGVMNLLVIALLALAVLLEKLLPGGERVAKAMGVAGMVAGVGLMISNQI